MAADGLKASIIKQQMENAAFSLLLGKLAMIVKLCEALANTWVQCGEIAKTITGK